MILASRVIIVTKLSRIDYLIVLAEIAEISMVSTLRDNRVKYVVIVEKLTGNLSCIFWLFVRFLLLANVEKTDDPRCIAKPVVVVLGAYRADKLFMVVSKSSI